MNRKNEKHGMSETSEYIAWTCMIDRCHNPKNRRFKDYGGRGVTVCDRWRTSFLAFIADVGMKSDPAMSIDRINNSGSYEPGNVRWAMPKVQASNRRTSHNLTIEGVTMTVSEWARSKGVSRGLLYTRIASGWPAELLFAESFAFKDNFLRHRAKRKAATTHCPAGHEYSQENTRLSKEGGRKCKACAKARLAAYEKIRVREVKPRRRAA